MALFGLAVEADLIFKRERQGEKIARRMPLDASYAAQRPAADFDAKCRRFRADRAVGAQDATSLPTMGRRQFVERRNPQLRSRSMISRSRGATGFSVPTRATLVSFVLTRVGR